MRLSSVSTLLGPPFWGASGGIVKVLAAAMTVPVSCGASPPDTNWNGLEIAQTVKALHGLEQPFLVVTRNSARGRSYGLKTLAGCVESVSKPPEVMPQKFQYENPRPAYIRPFGRVFHRSEEHTSELQSR